MPNSHCDNNVNLTLVWFLSLSFSWLLSLSRLLSWFLSWLLSFSWLLSLSRLLSWFLSLSWLLSWFLSWLLSWFLSWLLPWFLPFSWLLSRLLPGFLSWLLGRGSRTGGGPRISALRHSVETPGAIGLALHVLLVPRGAGVGDHSADPLAAAVPVGGGVSRRGGGIR